MKNGDERQDSYNKVDVMFSPQASEGGAPPPQPDHRPLQMPLTFPLLVPLNYAHVTTP